MDERIEPSAAFLDCSASVSYATGPNSSVFLLTVEVVAGTVELFALRLASNNCGDRRVHWRSRVAANAEVSFF